MLESLLPALLVASGGLLSVGPPLIVLLMLSAERGALKASLFLLGYCGGYTVIACVSLFLGRQMTQSDASGPSVFTSTALLVLGLLFLALATRNLVKSLRKTPQPPPRVFQSIDRLGPRRALLIGLMITVVNFKNLAIFLSAVAQLNGAWAQAAVGVPLVVLLFSATSVIPVALQLTFGERAAASLAAMRGWLERNSRAASVVVLTLFGALFVYRGVTGLL